MHLAYQDASFALPFEVWLRERNYCADPSAYLGQDLRPAADRIRELWKAQNTISFHGIYLDWSDLFREVAECCFQTSFDADHYNELGTELIADGISRLLPADWSIPGSLMARSA